MIINKLAIRGFKNHKDKTEYNLGKLTHVTGDNFQGKTSIGEAITWALMGVDLTGNERATNRLLNNSSKNMQVDMSFSFKGQEYSITRSRNGTKTDIYLDGSLAKDSDLIKFYRDKDTFLSVFNPNYFVSLTPKLAKDFLDSVLKKVENEEVFEQMTDIEAKLLRENNFINPNLFLTEKRAELRELEKDILFAEGFLSAKDEAIEVPDERFFDSQKLDTLKINEEEIADKIRELSDVEKATLIDITPLKNERDRARNEYTSIANELKELQNTIECPSCKFKIDLDSTTKERLKKSLNIVEKQGKELSLTIEKHKKENEAIKKQHDEALETNKSELLELEKQSSGIKDLIAKEEESKREISLNNAKRESMLKLQEENNIKSEKMKKEIESSSDKKSKINMEIDAAKSFNSVKLKMQSSEIDKHLDKVTIQLEKITKDGELKDDFKILYDDREFVTLSNSERIKVGLEIAKLIIAQTGNAYPIFIDNAESITNYNAPDTQIIESKVMEGQALNVKVVE